MLDEAGFPEVKIVASNDLDEHIIAGLKAQGAKIDSWGIGTQLITAADQPALGGVYKLVAREKDGEFVPVIKISGNPEKVSNPGFKEAYRIMNLKTGKAEADYLALQDEVDIQSGGSGLSYLTRFIRICSNILRTMKRFRFCNQFSKAESWSMSFRLWMAFGTIMRSRCKRFGRNICGCLIPKYIVSI